LLLPINLDFGYEPDCAVAVKIEYDPITNQPHYQVRSFLDKAQAYFNARVLQKIDQDWLKPVDLISQPPFFRQVAQDVGSEQGDQEFGNLGYSNGAEYNNYDSYKPMNHMGKEEQMYYVPYNDRAMKDQSNHSFRYNNGVVNANAGIAGNFNKHANGNHIGVGNGSMNQFFPKNYNSYKRTDSRYFKTT